MSYLKMKNINKVYPGDVQAVFDFNLEADEGEFIVLVGPSGCGKSTVLRMIAGLEEITSGDMLLLDTRINDQSPSEREVAMVFQDYALYGNMTVYQNIGFSLTIKGAPSDFIHSKVMDISKTVELYDYLNRYPKALSGGQRQRVAMGRSLAKRAKILLMDEPLSNLDAQLRQQTRRELALLHHHFNPTVVYVTHDQTEAMTLATKIVVMNEGHIQQIGTPYDIYHHPENMFTASFIGSPAINFIKGQIDNDHFIVSGENKEAVLKCRIPKEIADNVSDTDKIILGIRPEIVKIKQSHYPASDKECSFASKVETLEYYGAEYYASLKIGESLITCRIPASYEIRSGDVIETAFEIDKAHFFDEKTGHRLKGKR